MKAFLGMGLLGANFVRAMLKKEDQVQVWNRTASKATALEAEGAKAFADVAYFSPFYLKPFHSTIKK